MADSNFNLLEWYADHRTEMAVLRDPNALFALSFLNHVGQATRAELAHDLGIDAATLDALIEKLYPAGVIATEGTTLRVTPYGKKLLAEIGLTRPLPPSMPPEGGPENPTASPPIVGATTRAGSGSKFLWFMAGFLLVAVLFGGGAWVVFSQIRDPTSTPSAVLVQTSAPPSTSIPPIATNTPISSDTPRSTRTQTNPPTTIPANTPTSTETLTPTPTRTATPTRTLTSAFTPSPPPTRTFTPTLRPTPSLTLTFTPVPRTLTPTPMPIPVVNVRVEPPQINFGEQATLRWDIDNVIAVYLDGEGVVGHGSRVVSGEKTQTFIFRVVTAFGEQNYPVTLNVVDAVSPSIFEVFGYPNPANYILDYCGDPAVTIQADVTDNAGVKAVTLYYSYQSNNIPVSDQGRSRPMQQSSKITFAAEVGIGKEAYQYLIGNKGWIEYQILAVDEAGNKSETPPQRVELFYESCFG